MSAAATAVAVAVRLIAERNWFVYDSIRPVHTETPRRARTSSNAAPKFIAFARRIPRIYCSVYYIGVYQTLLLCHSIVCVFIAHTLFIYESISVCVCVFDVMNSIASSSTQRNCSETNSSFQRPFTFTPNSD